jgi:hypothetical protein
MGKFTEDLEAQENSDKNKMSFSELLVHASRKSGKSVGKITRDWWRLYWGKGKLSLLEYVTWQVYDDRFSQEEKERFVSTAVHWPLTEDSCDRTWDAATEDKFLADTILRAHGLPVPETVAVIDQSIRHFGDTPKLSTIEGLRDFLTQDGNLPLFGKALRGIGSFGVILISGADETHIHLKSMPSVTYAEFLETVIGDTPYVLQRVVQNHSAIDDFCCATATVRLVTLVRENDVRFPLAAFSIPGGGNIADAFFWRSGNACCNVDPTNGELLNIITSDGPDLVSNDIHPETGADIIGMKLPHWDKMLEVATLAAKLFAPVRYQSLDIALTDEGPVIIEINTGGGFGLPQNASGVGMMTDEMRQFFRDCGSKRV